MNSWLTDYHGVDPARADHAARANPALAGPPTRYGSKAEALGARFGTDPRAVPQACLNNPELCQPNPAYAGQQQAQQPYGNQGIPQGVPQRANPNAYAPQGVPQGALQGVPQGVPQGLPQQCIANPELCQPNPAYATQQSQLANPAAFAPVPQGVPQGVPQSLPQECIANPELCQPNPAYAAQQPQLANPATSVQQGAPQDLPQPAPGAYSNANRFNPALINQQQGQAQQSANADFQANQAGPPPGAFPTSPEPQVIPQAPAANPALNSVYDDPSPPPSTPAPAPVKAVTRRVRIKIPPRLTSTTSTSTTTLPPPRLDFRAQVPVTTEAPPNEEAVSLDFTEIVDTDHEASDEGFIEAYVHEEIPAIPYEHDPRSGHKPHFYFVHFLKEIINLPSGQMNDPPPLIVREMYCPLSFFPAALLFQYMTLDRLF